jgi:predicted regulator of Ras-like GTPase activity (Roadblock/LC7/MglB family)
VSVALEQAISNELSNLRQRLPDVTGTLIATVDGLTIAHEAEGLQVETLAAMAAAQLGLGRQFAMMAAQGSFHEAVVRADYGCLAVFAAGEVALLTVFATADLNLGVLLTPDATSTGTHNADARR